ncbi:nitrogen permease regulator of amino acid transport activity 3-domain-containing protein [Gorgonomyces haynaldii]|nr:nitrogen permease regulator of amino acid transport activity 3-domain-containing protein [Gorgonomyces haynaldii]
MLAVLLSSFSPRGHQLVFVWPNTDFVDLDWNIISDILSPKISMCDQRFELLVDGTIFLGHPTSLHQDRVGTGLKFSRHCQDKKMQISPSQLTMFNLVVALDTHQVEKELLDVIYRELILKATAALKYEQLRRGYVKKEIDLILGLREQGNTTSQILNQSSLARTLQSIYEAFLQDKIITINQSISLSLHSHRPITEMPVMRPYLALLLLSDPEEIIAQLLPNASPLLLEMIQIVTPTVCFEELQTPLNCSLALIYKMAAHLFVWGKAKFIHPVNIRNIYILSPDLDLSKLPNLNQDFQSRFPSLDLPLLLQDMSIPQPFSNIISKENKNLYMEACTFLLQRHLVQQLHMYMYLIVPESVCERLKQKGPLIISDPATPSPFERECIQMIASTHKKEMADLFLRMVPYLNGMHNVEEILFAENLSRRDLKSLLAEFRDEIGTTLHA